MKILIVEDEKDMQQALCYGMRKSGYAVDAADNGQDAVELYVYFGGLSELYSLV